MPYTILAAEYANPDNDAAIVDTSEIGSVAWSLADNPDEWAELLAWEALPGTEIDPYVPPPDVPADTETTNLKLPLSGDPLFGTVNDALKRLDKLTQLPVLDWELVTPPVAPAEGDRYVVASPAVGGWTGHDYEIAYWQDAAWKFVPPQEGMRLLSKELDEDILYVDATDRWVLWEEHQFIVPDVDLPTIDGDVGAAEADTPLVDDDSRRIATTEWVTDVELALVALINARVRHDADQGLTEGQQRQAQENIGAEVGVNVLAFSQALQDLADSIVALGEFGFPRAIDLGSAAYMSREEVHHWRIVGVAASFDVVATDRRTAFVVTTALTATMPLGSTTDSDFSPEFKNLSAGNLTIAGAAGGGLVNGVASVVIASGGSARIRKLNATDYLVM